MFPVFHIGTLSIQSPGLILIISLWLGITFAERYSFRRQISPDRLTNLVFFVLLIGIAGARLAYAAHYPDAFMKSPASLISLNLALLDPFGGFAFAFITALAYGQHNKMPFWATLDALTPIIVVIMIGLGFSHLASGTAFGTETTLPWGIVLWGAKRHPSQVYEIIAGFITLLLLLPDLNKTTSPGIFFLKFAAITSGWLLFLDAYRGDSMLLTGNIRSIQVLAWFVLAISLLGFEILTKQTKK